MTASGRKRPLRTRKRRATAGTTRSTSTRTRDQGGIAALVIALVLGAIGLSQSEWGGGGASDSGRRGEVTTDEGSATEGDAEGEVEGTVQGSAAEDALFAALNRARKAKRLPALRVSEPLARAARDHSVDLQATSRCSHDGSDGSSLEDRLAAVGAKLQRYGEVVACGSASAEAAVEQWMGSNAHRDIVLGRSYETVGVGVALGTEGASDARWTAVLGTP